ncbi:transposable element Tc3 transposase [Trichonephila clavata]|uniref:Transposable element Tc3 transposase n=1 Tax=Trichonephila clavata TaxID=2740835 RepID=A0A8X6I4K0_TRICU|nr:transposable element Tc3 transposase [Trichonephila clavata]
METALQKSPMKSSRKLAVQLGMLYSSTWRTACELNFRPFKIHVVHEMTPPDFEKKLHFCRWFRSFLNTYDIRKPDNVLLTNEAGFNLHGYVNSQKSLYRSTINPHIIQEWILHDEKFGVWYAV